MPVQEYSVGSVMIEELATIRRMVEFSLLTIYSDNLLSNLQLSINIPTESVIFAD
jgi:hypothetical protein